MRGEKVWQNFRLERRRLVNHESGTVGCERHNILKTLFLRFFEHAVESSRKTTLKSGQVFFLFLVGRPQRRGRT